ncbi:unnamed protein product, partial [Phaeothamnion confervicola]
MAAAAEGGGDMAAAPAPMAAAAMPPAAAAQPVAATPAGAYVPPAAGGAGAAGVSGAAPPSVARPPAKSAKKAPPAPLFIGSGGPPCGATDCGAIGHTCSGRPDHRRSTWRSAPGFEGSLAEVRLFHGARSETDIRRIGRGGVWARGDCGSSGTGHGGSGRGGYAAEGGNGCRGGDGPPPPSAAEEEELVALWRCCEGEGDRLADSCPRGLGGLKVEAHARLVGEFSWADCFKGDASEMEEVISVLTRGQSSGDAESGGSGHSGGAQSGEAAPCSHRSSSNSTSSTGDGDRSGGGGGSSGGDARRRRQHEPSFFGAYRAARRAVVDGEAGLTPPPAAVPSAKASLGGAAAGAEAGAAEAAAAAAPSSDKTTAAPPVGPTEARPTVAADEALLALCAHLFLQSTMYLAPAGGNPGVEKVGGGGGGGVVAGGSGGASAGVLGVAGAAITALQQLQHVRREQAAIELVVSPRPSTILLLHSLLAQLAQLAARARSGGGRGAAAPTTAAPAAAVTAAAVAMAGAAQVGAGGQGGKGDAALQAAAAADADESVAGNGNASGAAISPQLLLLCGLAFVRLLRVNLYHMAVLGVMPEAVGLAPPGRGATDGSPPFLARLLSLLFEIASGALDALDADAAPAPLEPVMASAREPPANAAASKRGGESPVPAAATADAATAVATTAEAAAAETAPVAAMKFKQPRKTAAAEVDVQALQEAVRWEAAAVLSLGLGIFFPAPAERSALLVALLQRVVDCSSGDGGALSSSAAGVAAGGAATTSASLPLPPPSSQLLPPSRAVLRLDAEGTCMVLTCVSVALATDAALLAGLAPRPLHAAVTELDVPSYVARFVGGGGGCGLSRIEVGDVVERGPDWCWGEQDRVCGHAGGSGGTITNGIGSVGGGGGSSGMSGAGGGGISNRGLVVDVAEWAQAIGKGGAAGGGAGGSGGSLAVHVMWPHGAINVYRWGVAAGNGAAAAFDVKLAGTTPASAASLSTAEEAAAAAAAAAAFSRESEEIAAVSPLLSLLLRFVGEPPAPPSDGAELAGGDACRREANASVSVLLGALHSLLTGGIAGGGNGAGGGASDGSAEEGLAAAETLSFVGASGQQRRWDWLACRHVDADRPRLRAAKKGGVKNSGGDGGGDGGDGEAVATEGSSGAQRQQRQQGRQQRQPERWRDDAPPLVEPLGGHCHGNIAVSLWQTTSIDFAVACRLEQGPTRGWGVALAARGFARGTGIHSWRVRLENVNRRGHVFIGVASRRVQLDGYLGADKFGWGALVSQDLYHGGARVGAGYGKRQAAGGVFELRLDTDQPGGGELRLADAVTGEDFGPAFQGMFVELESGASGGGGASDGAGEDVLLFPAIALHQPGDALRYEAATSYRAAVSSGAADPTLGVRLPDGAMQGALTRCLQDGSGPSTGSIGSGRGRGGASGSGRLTAVVGGGVRKRPLGVPPACLVE